MRELVFIIIMTGMMVLALGLIMPVRKEMNMKKANLEKLKEENIALSKELKDLNKERTNLEKKDPYSLLRVARETFDYCYPGEKIYKFPKHNTCTGIYIQPSNIQINQNSIN